jgi:hypothetical protein
MNLVKNRSNKSAHIAYDIAARAAYSDNVNFIVKGSSDSGNRDFNIQSWSRPLNFDITTDGFAIFNQ